MEQNPAYFCEPLSTVEYVDIMQYIEENPDHVYNTIATDGEGYMLDFEQIDVELDTNDGAVVLKSNQVLNIAAKMVLEPEDRGVAMQFLNGVVNNRPIIDTKVPITAEMIEAAHKEAINLKYRLRSDFSQEYRSDPRPIRARFCRPTHESTISVSDIINPRNEPSPTFSTLSEHGIIAKDVKLRTNDVDIFLEHNGQPITHYGEVCISAIDGRFKRFYAKEIINDRLVITEGVNGYNGTISIPSVIKRCYSNRNLKFKVRALNSQTVKDTEQNMINENHPLDQNTLFETGEISELKRQGNYLMSVEGDKYAAINPELHWIGSADTHMFGEELYVVNNITVYATNQSGTHISPAGINMLFLVNDNIAMRVPRMSGMTTPEITGYNKAKLYSISETNRVFLNEY